MFYSKVIVALGLAGLLTGCGDSGSGGGQPEPEEKDSVSVVNGVRPECDDTTPELAGCWASTCELLESGDPSVTFYGRSVIAFSSGGELRHYLQSFDNANCVAPPRNTAEMSVDITFELLPRVDGRDEGNVDGYVAFNLSDTPLATPDGESVGASSIVDTPYDVTAEGLLCFDSYLVSFTESGYGFRLGAPGSGIDYDSCLTALR